MKLGNFEIRTFVEQEFRLDGGSMFGVVPKSLWQKLIPADENNLIPMVTNLYVLEADGRTILFEAGLGDSLSDREKKIYGTVGESRIESGLEELGYTVDDIDVVILTHLHTDHCAGAVKRNGDRHVPRFPKAEYIIDRREWDQALHPDERTGAVYVPDRLISLEMSGQVKFIEGDTELFPGIRTIQTGGHTPYHFGLEIESGGEYLYYYADILCTTAHLRIAYIPATDLDPLQSMRSKRDLLSRVQATNGVVAFDHDVKMPLARLRQDGRKLFAEPVAETTTP